MKKFNPVGRVVAPLSIAALMVGGLTACTAADTTASGTTAESSALCTESTGAETTSSSVIAANSQLHTSSEDYVWDDADAQEIVLSGESVTISQVGTYRISGTIEDGQIVVDTSATGLVRLVFDGVSISNSAGAAVDIVNAPEVMIVLAEGSTNVLRDAESYDESATAPAAIYSTSNLTITGDGALTVEGRGNDGIVSKDGLVISGGDITVTAADDAIRGKDYVVVEDGSVNLTAGGDGISADNDATNTRGFVALSGGTVTVSSQTDAVQAGTDVVIDGGVLYASAADDAVNAGCVVVFDGGESTLESGDDAVHSDAELFVLAGSVTVTEAYEGLEATSAYIAGGDVSVTSSDDGINIAGGADSSGGAHPEPANAAGSTETAEESTEESADSVDAFTTTVDSQITISGGNITINSEGDGLDTNTVGTITGGTIVVYGPEGDGNGSMDGDFTISGGTLLAVGSAGMAIAPNAESEQASIKVALDSQVGAGETITVVDSDGNVIAEFDTVKTIASVVYSGSALVAGQTYTIYNGSIVVGSGVAGEYENNEFGGGMGGERPEPPAN